MYTYKKQEEILPIFENLTEKYSQQDLMEGLFKALGSKTEFFADPKAAKKMIWSAYKEGNKQHLNKQDDEWEIIQEKEDVEEVVIQDSKINTLKQLTEDFEKKYTNITNSNTNMMKFLEPENNCNSPTINKGTQTSSIKTQATCSQTLKNTESFTNFMTKKRDFTTQTFEIIKSSSYVLRPPPLSNRCQRILDTICKKQMEKEKKLQTLNLVENDPRIPKPPKFKYPEQFLKLGEKQEPQVENDSHILKHPKLKYPEEILKLGYKYQPLNNGYQMEKYGWTQQLGEIQINMKIPENVKARNLLVQIRFDKIFVKMIRNGSNEILMDKKLKKDICESESYWQIEKKEDGSRELVMFLQKDRKQWWASAFVNDPEIDVAKIRGKNDKISQEEEEEEGDKNGGKKTLLEETNTFLLDCALSSSYLMNKLSRQSMVNTLLV